MTLQDAEIAQIFSTDVTAADEAGVITHLMRDAGDADNWVAELVTRSGHVLYIDIEELSTA